MGLSSVVMVKMPSNLRSSEGFVTSADIWTLTLWLCEIGKEFGGCITHLVLPRVTVAEPSCSPKVKVMFLN